MNEQENKQVTFTQSSSSSENRPRYSTQQSSQQPALPQCPTNDKEAWKAYWKAQDQPWRIDPEIDKKRQAYLTKRRTILPDINQGIYPFAGADLHLSRADLEWLLATHESGGLQGPVIWDDEKQREREGLDLRGADLRGLDLRGLPLARLRAGLTHLERVVTNRELSQKATIHLEDACLIGTHLEGAYLARARLENSDLRDAYFQHTELVSAHLEGAYLGGTQLGGASLRRAFFNTDSELERTILASKENGSISLADVRWGGVNLTTVDWSLVNVLEDECNAKRHIIPSGRTEDPHEVLNQYETAIRANRQCAEVLRSQGLNVHSDRFAYRAQRLEQVVLRRRRKLGRWFISFLMDILAGYGYKPLRCFLAYAATILIFMLLYLINSHFVTPHIIWNEALVLSVSSFHGRGFFNPSITLSDTYAELASIEAFIGLILEITLIAAFTQRFLAR